MRTRILHFVVAAIFVGGCSVKSAQISNIEELTVAETGCAWVQVDQRTVERVVWLLGSFDSVTDDLPFHDELYLCCPGDKADPTPMCHEARWFRNKKD